MDELSAKMSHFSSTPLLIPLSSISSAIWRGLGMVLGVATLVFVYKMYDMLVVRSRSKNPHIPKVANQSNPAARIFHEPRVGQIEKWIDETPNQGLIRYHGMYNLERIFITSPQAAKELLVNEAYSFIKPEIQHQMAAKVAGEGLLLLEGDTHKRTAKHFAGAFHADRIREAYQPMWESTAQVMKKISTNKGDMNLGIGLSDTKDHSRNILKLISAATIDIIGSWGFGTNMNAVSNTKGHELSRFSRSYVEVLKGTDRGQIALTLCAMFGTHRVLSLPLKIVDTINGVMDLTYRTSDKIVKQHEADFDAEKLSNKVPSDMLYHVMKSEDFSHNDLVEETVHFFAASTETSAGTICWGLHLLARHPEVQAKLRDEIRQNLSNPLAASAQPFKESAFKDLKYLDAVVKETLRFHSINTLLWREAVNDSKLCGQDIAKGSIVVYSPWVLGRDTRNWGPDAKEFRPERWLESAGGGANHNNAFMTFGTGPRRCIGEAYSRALMRCVLAGIIGQFEFRPIEQEYSTDVGREIADDSPFTLFKIQEGWRLNIKEVEGW